MITTQQKESLCLSCHLLKRQSLSASKVYRQVAFQSKLAQLLLNQYRAFARANFVVESDLLPFTPQSESPAIDFLPKVYPFYHNPCCNS